MPVLKNIAFAVVSFFALFLVVLVTKPPQSWAHASTTQILILFLPLLAFLTFTANILIRDFRKSFIIGLEFMVLLVLFAIGKLNAATVGVSVSAAILALWMFPKNRRYAGGAAGRLNSTIRLRRRRRR